MSNFIGEFECRVDDKSRIMLPAGLKKQLDPAAQEKFVVNRGFGKYLVLYPMNEWEKISKQLAKLNMFVQKNRDFVRYFQRGATELVLDGTGRLLLPKRLLAYASIKKEVVFSSTPNGIEVWAKDLYEGFFKEEPEDYATLAEEVMGKINDEDKEIT
ncbi:MAG: division/cell wall cluster transcriptional repressor MraZ [Bacteroidota bacterium]